MPNDPGQKVDIHEQKVTDRISEVEIVWWLVTHPEDIEKVLTRCPSSSFNTHMRVLAEALLFVSLRGLPVNPLQLQSASLAAGYSDGVFNVAWKLLNQEASTLSNRNTLEAAILSVNSAALSRKRAVHLGELSHLISNPNEFRAKLEEMVKLEKSGSIDSGGELPRIETIEDIEKYVSNTQYHSLIGDGLLNRTGLMWIHAADGIGKTALALQLAACLATGRKWLGIYPAKETKVLYLQGEVDRAWWKRRVDNLVKFYGGTYLGKLSFCQERFYLTEWDSRNRRVMLNGLRRLELLVEGKYDVLVIDPLVSYYALEENSTDQNRYFINALLDFRKANKVAVIGVHHDRKSTKEDRLVMRGSGVLRGASDASVTIDGKHLVWDKLRHTRNPGRLPIKMDDLGFWLADQKEDEENGNHEHEGREKQASLLP